MRKLLVGFLAVVFMAHVGSLVAFAQMGGETGQLSGTVTDPTGAVIPGARVAITHIATGTGRTVTTDNRGVYIVPGLRPGIYEVTVESAGFAVTERRVEVTVGKHVTLDISLTVGAAIAVVEVVSAGGVSINTETQTIGELIDSKEITEFPTLTRNPYDLVLIAGNISEAEDTGRGVGVAINGQRSTSTNILLDGASNVDYFVVTPGQNIPLDAVAEFSILTSNFTAEYGRAAGGIVNVVTKSGTNDVNGTAYYFYRGASLTANTFDNNANGIEQPNFIRHQFGYSVGGPVIKNKLFAFQSTEWTRVRSSASRIRLIPTSQFLALTAPATQAFFNAFGTRRPGLTTLSTLTKGDLGGSAALCTVGGLCDALAGTLPMFDRVQYNVPSDSGGGDPQDTYTLVGRMDWTISDKTSLYGRYALEDLEIFAGSVADSPYAGFDTPATTFNNNMAVTVMHSFSPQTQSQTKVVFNRLNIAQPLGEQPNTPTLFMRTSRVSLLGTTINYPGYGPGSPGTGLPFGGPQNFIQIYEDVSYVKGAHQFKFGGQYVYIRDNRTFGAYANPSATLGNNTPQAFENFLLGELVSFASAIDPQGKLPCVDPSAPTPDCTLNLPVGQPNFSRSNRYHEFGFYVQDSWRASPDLVLNLGLRWEYYGIQHDKDPFNDSNYFDGAGGAIFERIRKGGIAQTPNSVVGGLWGKDWNNFAPRLGFAWDMFGNGRTSLRGGWGLAYERNFGNVTFNVIQNPPNYAVVALTAFVDVPGAITIPTDIAGPLAGSVGSAAIPRASLRNVKEDIKTAYAHFWSLSIERELARNTVLSIDYSGSKGVDLYSLEWPNKPGQGNVSLGDPCLDTDLDGSPNTGNPFACTSRLTFQGIVTDPVTGVERYIGRFSNLNRRGGNGLSLHNSLNLRFNTVNLADSGASFTINYTWAHTIDNLSSTFSEGGQDFNLGLLDAFDPDLDRSNANFDVRNRIAISGRWEIPFARDSSGVTKRVLDGWSLVPIFTAQTGAPFTLWSCDNAFFFVCARSFLANGSNLASEVTSDPQQDSGSPPNTFNLFDLPAAAFTSYAHPIVGSEEFGPFPANMVGRNSFRGPGQWNLTLGFYKTTYINENFSIQFRGEFFNIFNHPNTTMTAFTACQVCGDFIPGFKEDRRNIQLAVKLLF